MGFFCTKMGRKRTQSKPCLMKAASTGTVPSWRTLGLLWLNPKALAQLPGAPCQEQQPCSAQFSLCSASLRIHGADAGASSPPRRFSLGESPAPTPGDSTQGLGSLRETLGFHLCHGGVCSSPLPREEIIIQLFNDLNEIK